MGLRHSTISRSICAGPGSHEADALWARIDPEAWDKTRNPWFLLQDISTNRLRALAADPVFVGELQRLTQARDAYLNAPGWFGSSYVPAGLGSVAYFSMEFGLGEALPLYAGGSAFSPAITSRRRAILGCP